MPLGVIGVNLQAALASEQAASAEVVGDVYLATNLILRMGVIRVDGGQGVGVLLGERRGVVEDFINSVHGVAADAEDHVGHLAEGSGDAESVAGVAEFCDYCLAGSLFHIFANVVGLARNIFSLKA